MCPWFWRDPCFLWISMCLLVSSWTWYFLVDHLIESIHRHPPLRSTNLLHHCQVFGPSPCRPPLRLLRQWWLESTSSPLATYWCSWGCFWCLSASLPRRPTGNVPRPWSNPPHSCAIGWEASESRHAPPTFRLCKTSWGLNIPNGKWASLIGTYLHSFALGGLPHHSWWISNLSTCGNHALF